MNKRINPKLGMDIAKVIAGLAIAGLVIQIFVLRDDMQGYQVSDEPNGTKMLWIDGRKLGTLPPCADDAIEKLLEEFESSE